MGWHGPLTYYQFLVWRAWHDAELNNPGKTEYYLMALRADFEARALGKDVDPNTKRVRVERKAAEGRAPVTQKEAVKQMHQLAMARIGASNVRVKRERD